jgi:hypothetical protein
MGQRKNRGTSISSIDFQKGADDEEWLGCCVNWFEDVGRRGVVYIGVKE